MEIRERIDNARIPEAVSDVLARLEAAGFEAYLVGGCVRDWLMGNTPKDYDVTTNALVEQTQEVFRDFRVVETGIKHGTVTVISEGIPIEVTTYRVDGSYSDGRHPDRVCFTSRLRDDLSRRDFTVNALAYSPARGFVDGFGGTYDLDRKSIRCVGNPDKRFGEDALRILRALRFASVLGFSVEKQTAASLHRNRLLLKKIAKERVTEELLKLLCGDGAERVLREFSDVIAVILPQLTPMFGFAQHNAYHIYDVWEHTLRVVAAVPPDRGLRLAALLHDSGKPRCFTLDENGVGHFYGHANASEEIAKDIFCQSLRLDKATAERVRMLVRYHDEPIEPSRKIVRRRLMKHGETALRDLIALHRADIAGQSPDKMPDRLRQMDEAEQILDELTAEHVCVSVSDLHIRGSDLINSGIPQGKAVGEVLRRLLQEVGEETLQNEPEALRKRALEIYSDFSIKKE